MDPNQKGSKTGRTVGLIDPAMEQGGPWDVNLGDQIISESVVTILEQSCGLRVAARVPSLRNLRKAELKTLRECDHVIVGGTNLLSSNMREYRQWIIDLWDSLYLKNVILLGVGWWQYQQRADLYTRILLRRVLSKKHYHSVRDNYTKEQLVGIGVRGVLNTSCPTLWGLSRELQESIPKRKADQVITTLTYYKNFPDEDKQFLELLKRSYRKVFLWAQGDMDANYANEICPGLTILTFGLGGFDRFLVENHDLDYVGTRLHAGIRAVRRGKRTLILSVDNRATEIGKDTNLNTASRGDLAQIEDWINSEYKTDIKLPDQEIRRWIAQFAGGA